MDQSPRVPSAVNSQAANGAYRPRVHERHEQRDEAEQFNDIVRRASHESFSGISSETCETVGALAHDLWRQASVPVL
jgi:hypothetical protein